MTQRVLIFGVSGGLYPRNRLENLAEASLFLKNIQPVNLDLLICPI